MNYGGRLLTRRRAGVYHALIGGTRWWVTGRDGEWAIRPGTALAESAAVVLTVGAAEDWLARLAVNA